MPVTEVELVRRTSSGGPTVPWLLTGDGKDPVDDETTHARLQTVIDRLTNVITELQNLEVTLPAAVDVSDRAGRQLGQVSVPSTVTVDLDDDPGRMLGQVTVTGELEVKNDAGSPIPTIYTGTQSVSVANLSDIQVASDFHHLLKFEPLVGQEVRRDETTTDDYHGAAPDGTSTAATQWRVVRFYKTAGKIVRVRYRTGVAWDNRTAGW